MASLLDRLRTNSQVIKGGAAAPLTETSTEELQGLAKQSGLPVPPSTPLGAEGIGATADQAKMLGTPAQETGALRMQTREQDQLATQQREEQARKQATAQEQAVRTQALKLEGLGSLGDRVQQLATSMLNQTSAGANQIAKAQTADTTKVSQYIAPGADVQQTTDLLNKLGSNNISDQDMVQLAINLGYTDVSDLGQLKTAIGNEFLSKEEQVGAFTADQVANNITVSQFTPDQLQKLGFNNINDMAAALNTDPAKLQGMSIRELQDQFGKNQLDNFAKSQKAQGVLADPSASRVEKEEALKELKELGATGVRAAESDVKKLQDQVTKASTVQFGGESYQVEDLLKDDTIKGLVKNYLTDPEAAKALKDKEPQFAQWIDDNQKVLANAATDVNARQDAFAKIQLDNMKLGETDSGTLSDDAMKAMIPDFGKIKAVSDSAPPFLAMVKNKEIPENTAVDMINTMNTLAGIAPDYVQSMAGLSPAEINQLGLNTSDGIRNYRDYVTSTSQILKAPEADLLSTMTGGMLDDAAMKDMIASNAAMKAFGIGDVKSGAKPLMDAYDDGGPEAMKNKYLELTGGLGSAGALTVKEMLDKGIKPADLETSSTKLVNLQTGIINTEQSNDLFRKYGDMWKGDNTLTEGEAINFGSKMADKADINTYYDVDEIKAMSKTIGQAAYNQLEYYQNKTGETVAQNVLNGLGYGNRSNWDNDVQALMSGAFDGAKVDKMQGAMTELANQMVNNKTYRGSAFQYHMKYRVDAMANALASNIQKIPVEDQPDAALEQVKNLAKVLKYGPAPQVTAGLDAYRELNKFTEDKFGFSLPAEGGVEELNKKIDAVSRGIAAVGRDFFRDPRAAANAAISGNIDNVRNVVASAGGGAASAVQSVGKSLGIG